MKRADLTGKRFGGLVVLSFSHIANGHSHWVCVCDCGHECVVAGGNLQNGHTKACGCSNRNNALRHGGSKDGTRTKEYWAWQGMKKRCYHPSEKSYSYYGGRGIRVCERWLNSYENFLADMGRAPGPDHSIDRTDNEGNYEPGNCRWATKKQQTANRRPWTKRKAS